MKLLRDISVFISLLIGAFLIIYLIEGKRFNFSHLIDTETQEVSTQKVIDRTDSVIDLVDKKIIEVHNIKEERDQIIDSLNNKIITKDLTSKNDLDILKRKINDVERIKNEIDQKPVFAYKVSSIRKTDTTYVFKYDTSIIHDTVIVVNVIKDSIKVKSKYKKRKFLVRESK